MKISNIPAEVFAVALKYENIELWDNDLNRAEDCYHAEIQNRGWTQGGLEKALSKFLLKEGEFSESGVYEESANYGYEIHAEKSLLYRTEIESSIKN